MFSRKFLLVGEERKRMARKSDEVAVVKAAILAAKGLSQTGMKPFLRGLSQSRISRLLKAAKEKGYLVERPPCLQEGKVPADLLQEAQRAIDFFDLRQKLADRLSRLAPSQGASLPRQVTIIPSPNYGTSPEEWHKRCNAVGLAAARRFLELLPAMRCVGILHGPTMRALVDSVCSPEAGRLNKKVGRKKQIQFLPLSGEAFFLAESYDTDLSASELARSLAQAINGSIKGQLSLQAILAYIPVGFGEAESETIRRLAAMVPAYQKIFGNSSDPTQSRTDGLIRSVDTILTGMAGIAREYAPDPWIRQRVRAIISEETLQEYIAGDIAGIVLPRTNAGKPARDLAEKINRQGLCIQLHDLQHCARESARSKGEKPGVIVVAHGKSKAEILIEAVRAGCVNELIIDDDLACEVDRRLELLLRGG